jgi:hypothetical protein
MEKVIHKITFERAEESDRAYWASKSPEEKIEALWRMRYQFHGGQQITKVIRKVPHAGR